MSATAMVELRPGTSGARMAVGMAEPAGLSSIRRFLDIPHLERVQASFAAVCQRVLSTRDAVLVPHGEGVIYAVGSHEDAVALGHELVAEAALDALLPPTHVGVASGTVLVTEGRCYGPAVDVAARRMADADPGAVSQRD